MHVFFTLADVREKLERWREDHNQVRPHSALADVRWPSRNFEIAVRISACPPAFCNSTFALDPAAKGTVYGQ